MEAGSGKGGGGTTSHREFVSLFFIVVVVVGGGVTSRNVSMDAVTLDSPGEEEVAGYNEREPVSPDVILPAFTSSCGARRGEGDNPAADVEDEEVQRDDEALVAEEAVVVV